MEYNEKILICEDDSALLSLLRFKLSRAGYTNCETVQDGKEAKQLLQENEYDLVISDIYMPFISGLELTTFLREEKKSIVPIIIMSAEGVEDTVLKSFSIGVSDFVTKPLSPNELIIRIKRLLGHH